MKTLIGISGRIASGKDTVTAMINEITNHMFAVHRFAGKLKLMAEMFTAIPADDYNSQDVKLRKLGPEWNNMTVREFLQKLGTDAVRDGLHKNSWVNALFSTYTVNSQWVIPDVRFPNEFEAIRQRGGVIIRIERPGYKSDPHPSETALDGFDFDYIIQNNRDMDVLRTEVTHMLAYFGVIELVRKVDVNTEP